MLATPILLVSLALTVSPPGTAGFPSPDPGPGPRPEGPEFEYEKLELVLDLGGLDELEGGPTQRGWVRGLWDAEFDGVELEIVFGVLERAKFEFDGPYDVVDTVAFNRGNRAREKGGSYSFDDSKALIGEFGYVPYGWFASHDRYEGTLVAGHDLVIAGMTKTQGYVLEITATPALSDEQMAAFEKWAATCVRYSGETWDPRWTEEERKKRWADDAPDAVADDKHLIIPTKYYVVFTDIGKGTAKAFGKKLDENYEKIRSVLPFEDVPGERLLPIFYFTNREHYLDWWVKNLGGSRESAERSGGVASGDVYSTYHQSVNAPVHIHEQTHQIFRNRLRLSGGGSWFQEGVAEYMSSKPGELGEIKRLAQKGRLTPMKEFFVVPSLLMSSSTEERKEGGSQSGLAYTYSAAICEFAKHSEFGREKFLAWVHAMGKVARNALPAIEREMARVYGVTVDEFEEEFTKYWSKRKKVRNWHEPADDGKGKKKKRRR